MASLTLESLPVELVEEIVAWLDFHDHCALRLTGRSVSVKSSKAAFRKYFLSKKLEIAEAPLEQFVSVTQPGRFGLWVQDLTLFASIALHAEVPPASPKVFELLAQAFQNIRNDSPHNEPLSITLKVFGDGYLKAAADTVFQVTMSALRRSGLPIRAFNAFAEGYSHTYGGRCSFPFSEIPDALFGGSTADLTRLATAFQPCKKIGLSLAHYIHNLDYIRPRESPLRPDNLFELPPSYEEARENTRSLPHLLNLCPTLEELHLVWEYDDFEETAGVREELYFFERVVASCQFQGLKKCTLSDIRMSEATLMTFFRQLTRLVHLDLTSIYLDGNFDGLFRLLSTAMPELNYLHLRSLYSSSGTVRFLHEPRNNIVRFPSCRPSRAQILIRRGADARRSVITRTRSDQEQFWNNTQITQNKLKVAQPMPTARLVEVELPEWRKDSHLCRMEDLLPGKERLAVYRFGHNKRRENTETISLAHQSVPFWPQRYSVIHRSTSPHTRRNINEGSLQQRYSS
ncbi:uncharacterized protein BO96DRAFT_434255 [Aspergillus niger CBS 101883]|uniref:uncharacterized protein n=1 Tax=Aspergillus lacticoffeatus (strain CBS 101883) TaxID=1450533 RepID=UPI000D7FE9BE|nr:uncharacterized protein BO96DRAFT_434255 [Aspergillus niger CBS 101883]PYH56272.1 hypothetical protein BO96DRAFT_434255 [Aspergillus niger CBS 101883]